MSEKTIFKPEEYKDLVEHSTELISLHDIDGVYLFASAYSEALLGYSSDELVGRNAYDYFHPDDLANIQRSHRYIQESGQTFTLEYRCRHKNGSYVWVETTSKVIAATKDTPEKIIANTRSVEDRKEIELRLIESESQLKLSQSVARIGHYVLDFKTGVWSSSETLDEIFGIGPEYDRSIQTWLNIIRSDYQQVMQAYFMDEVIGKQVKFDRTYPILNQSSGTSFWVHGLGKLETDRKGTILRMFGTIQDITEHKKAEEELHASEERFHKMFRDHDAVMLLIEPKTGEIVDANNSAAAFYGYSTTEFRQLTMHQINTLAPGIVTTVHDKVLSGQQTCFEFKHRLSSGEIRNVEVHISPIEIRNQTLFFSINHDVTQRKRLMEEQSRSAQLAALGTVAAGVAHEINNPIQGIMNYAGIIERAPGHSERNLEIAKRIKDESKRIARITQDLLFYSKDSRLDMKIVDIRETIEGASSLIATKVRNEGACLEIVVEEDLPRLLLQPQSIQQVVINLVDNACDALRYKSASTVQKTIRVHTYLLEGNENPYLCIEVYDNGIGMSEETMQKSQEAFFTTKPPAEGTGLGLSIVNDIIKKHNGRIEIDSKEGEYTKIKALVSAITDSQE